MLIDLHQDLYLYHQWPEQFPGRDQVSPKQIRDLGANIVIVSAFAGNQPVQDYGVTEIEMWQHAWDYYRALPANEFYIVKELSDLDDTENQGKTGLIFHFEGIYQDLSVADLDKWHDQGLRSVGLTWAESSPYAGGNTDPTQGLTASGREIIDWCLQKNVLIDLSHMSELAFNQTADLLVSKPLLVSHANARVICSNGGDRNLSDEQLRRIGDSGGVVGIMFARSLVSGERQGSIADVIAHIKHVVDVAGIDSVAIGSDFGGILSEPMITGLKKFRDLNKFRNTIELQFGLDFSDKLFSQNAIRVIADYLG